jgi:hypothetical protein
MGKTNSCPEGRRQPIDLLRRIPKQKVLGIEARSRLADKKI